MLEIEAQGDALPAAECTGVVFLLSALTSPRDRDDDRVDRGLAVLLVDYFPARMAVSTWISASTSWSVL